MAYSPEYLVSYQKNPHRQEVSNLVYDIDSELEMRYKGQRRFYFSLPEGLTLEVLRDVITRYKNAGWNTVAYASGNRLMFSRYVIHVM